MIKTPLPFVFIEQQTKAYPVMVSVPHSGRFIPSELINNTSLDAKQLRASEDFYIDEICNKAPEIGFDYLYATIARAYLDINRAPDSLDNKLIDGILKKSFDEMALAGQGIIPRLMPGNHKIHLSKISIEDANQRIENVWKPYHDIIKQNLANLQGKFGFSIMFDMHSMPNSALGFDTTDIIIGDCHGKSCTKALSAFALSFFKDQGLKARMNRPYAGGYITSNYGAPNQNSHVIQIEINRNLYMNETTIEKTNGFTRLEKIITKFFTQIREAIKDGAIIDAN